MPARPAGHVRPALAIAVTLALTLVALCLHALRPEPARAASAGEMWVSSAALSSRPTSGRAWSNLLSAADALVASPRAAKIADQSSSHDVRTLAAALVWARTGRSTYRSAAATAVDAAVGTEAGGRTLALGRNLPGYVIAADLIRLDELDAAKGRRFRTWLAKVRTTRLDGLTLVSTHEKRPNNWGTHAGAARVAADIYLGDRADLARAATVFRGWLGDRSAYAGFKFGSLAWQCDPRRPVGVNPAGCTIGGHPLGGAQPDDMRRAGGFEWPPPKENYAWEALQGAVVQAELLSRAGFPAWRWSDGAVVRAVRWLQDQASFQAQGDDTWIPFLVNRGAGARLAAPGAARSGKNMGFTDFTHG
jgi:hypothetical protein